MAPTPPPDAPSPSSSSIRLPLSMARPRRGSINSLSSRTPADKDIISSALDSIHTSASRSESLTTFDEFGSPPKSSNGADSKSLAGDLVHGGLSGLYNRLRASVGASKDSIHPLAASIDGADDASVRGHKSQTGQRVANGYSVTSLTSPVVVSSPASRLNSPAVASFPESSSRPSSSGVPLASKSTTTIAPSPIKPQSKSSPSLVPKTAHSRQISGGDEQEPVVSTATGFRLLDTPTGDGPIRGSRKSTLSEPVYSVHETDTESLIGSETPPQVHDLRRELEADASLRGANDEGIVRNLRLQSPREDHHPDDEAISVEPELILDGESHTARQRQLARSDASAAMPPPQRPAKSHSTPMATALPSRLQSQTPYSPLVITPAHPRMEPNLMNVSASEPAVSSSGAMQRPPMIQVSQSHLPGYRPSRATSSDGELSSVGTVTGAPLPSFQTSLDTQSTGNASARGERPHQMRSKIVAKEFWMRDENAKDCFYCGDTFSTFRRKHHCRTCGQIFDAKCTSLVTGRPFGQAGNIRVCKPCENIINGTDDDSSVYSDHTDHVSLRDFAFDDAELEPKHPIHGSSSGHATHEEDYVDSDHTKIGTPTIGIALSTKSKAGETKRRSAVLEFDDNPSLARPSSSRSLRSLSGRTQSHKRHHSRHQHMRNFKSSYEDRAPFQRQESDELRTKPLLPAFHHDNIIDPDLAPFMSDEGSSDGEDASIFATLNGDARSPPKGLAEKSGLSGLLASVRKGRSRTGERHTGTSGSRDVDAVSIASRSMQRHTRNRNLSISSLTHSKPSPRRSKSNSLLKGFPVGIGTPGDARDPARPPSVREEIQSKLTRSASMRGAAAPAVELNQASLQHVKRMLVQMLQDSAIPHVRSWERALVPILLQCTDDVNPDVQRDDSMDIRHYIKLKKVPGGRPGDTTYVSGVVFTKNVALKSMPRCIPHPRIVIVTFAIEYARHQQHFMSLEPVIAQEREYLRNLVKRIAALNPHVLLVQKNVAGLALQLLEEENIAVVFNVKKSVLNAVSRCTQTRLISSVDKLAIDPTQLGRCGSFDVKSYVFDGMKKTYVYLSGCRSDLGCTIVLRGADTETLRKLKRITEFMCFVVYNLKLETCLMRDEFVLIPSNLTVGTLSPSKSREQKATDTHMAPLVQPETETKSEATEPISPRIDKSETSASEQYSSSELDSRPGTASVSDVGPAREARPEVQKEIKSVSEQSIPVPSFYDDVVEKHKTTILSASPFVKFMQPYLLMQAREQEGKIAKLKRLRDQYTPTEVDDQTEEKPQSFELVKPEMVRGIVDKPSKQVREFLFAVHNAEYEKAMHTYLTQKRQWETHMSANANLFDPFTHQRIAILYSMVNSVTSTPCIGPEIIALGFYSEHDLDDGFARDITLGQYVEDLCQGAGTICTQDGCGKSWLNHSRQYVHGQGQMSVLVQKHPSKIRGLQNTILMWSSCRRCGQETQVIPMSDNTWKYSFGKYLELTFWSSQLHPRAGICPHDIHRDHIRYFGFANIAMRIQYDDVALHEVIVPRTLITWKVDGDLNIKNDQYENIKERLDKFMMSVKCRIKSIHVQSVVPEKYDACKAELERMAKAAHDDHEWLATKLQEKYMKSRYYEIIPFNRAVRAMHEKAISWDDAFADFERNFFPSEKDIRRLAALQLRKLFLDRDESSASITSIEENPENQADEKHDDRRVTLKPHPSNLSEEEAQKMLGSVVREHHALDEKGPEGDHDLVSNASASPTALRAVSPKQTPQDPVVANELQHLDLALPASSTPESALTSGQSESSSATVLPDQKDTVPASSFSPLVRAISPEMSRAPSPSLSGFDGNTESRIPRPVDSNRKDTGLMPPPLNRTQSQPAHSLTMRRQQNSGMATPSSLLGQNSSGNKMEQVRASMAEHAKALEKRLPERLGLGSIKFTRAATQSLIPRSVSSKRGNDSRVSTLTKHFEQITREFERERARERRQRAERTRQARAYPLASTRPTVEVYGDANEAMRERGLTDEDSGSPLRTSLDQSTLGDSAHTEKSGQTDGSKSPPLEGSQEDVAVPSPRSDARHHHTSDIEGEASDIERGLLEDIDLPGDIEGNLLSPTGSQLDLELPKHEKTSVMKMLRSFWSERSASGWAPLDYPLNPIEHVWEDSDIIVREDEPSSVIALALSDADYQSKLSIFRNNIGDGKPLPQNSSAQLESDEEMSIQRNLLIQKSSNIIYAFKHRGVHVRCKIFYAESFDAMRRKCGVADRFVESMSRSVKWDSKGGKSKSIFLRTLDDRFVLKSLSAPEFNAFSKFAPDYFVFVHQNLYKSLPSVMAKMLGLFQVTIRNPASGMEFDQFLLVMENLFYDREPHRRFDLKGSMRNRKINATGERDEVLQDENLVDIIFQQPIFVREHTMMLLKASVWNDTLFLSKQNVMDYSLMAGFDDDAREIVVGIIDCIRTYTWDKKLETWIKDRGKHKPTITSPKDYRNRFRIAMSKYILQAPNCWHQFSAAQSQKKPVQIVGEGSAPTDAREDEMPEEKDAPMGQGQAHIGL
ncbi:hypothetical protein K402DRAFT_460556 [Aulographum hederae CBS 113979]|uniref:1-phosphatidylinositol-3-phosphate 5-kinase n=1 Tax=Aulographum hederae CBS 113979 TaxID=1176131 RepID=A0A6G1HBT5_9PEZI|nr:hypothetical protein K402DRAFT_460556 [Aulographum hederae CBS 113979]